MKCIAVTPEKTVVSKDVRFVVVPLYDGEYGVDKDHSPVVGRVGAGEMRLTLEDGTIERWYVEGGFVEVADNVVSLLTNVALPANELEPGKERESLDKALVMPANSPERMAIRDEAVLRARARVRLAEKNGAQK